MKLMINTCNRCAFSLLREALGYHKNAKEAISPTFAQEMEAKEMEVLSILRQAMASNSCQIEGSLMGLEGVMRLIKTAETESLASGEVAVELDVISLWLGNMVKAYVKAYMAKAI